MAPNSETPDTSIKALRKRAGDTTGGGKKKEDHDGSVKKLKLHQINPQAGQTGPLVPVMAVVPAVLLVPLVPVASDVGSCACASFVAAVHVPVVATGARCA